MKKHFVILIVCLPLVVLSYFLDDQAIEFIKNIHSSWLDLGFTWITQFRSVFVVFFVMTTLFMWESKRGNKLIAPLWASFFLSNTISYIIKLIFMRRRPFGASISLLGLPDYSFPSAHTTIAFAAAVILQKRYPKLAWFWYILAVAVGLSRLYVQIHYLSDVATGAWLGYAIGSLLLYFTEKNSPPPLVVTPPAKVPEKSEFKEFYNIELRRQIFHLTCGLGLVICIYFQLVNTFHLFLLLGVGIILSFICKNHRVPIVSWALDKMERKHTYPGKGAITYLVGALLSLQLFPKDIALAAILILALGDSISTLIGPLGKHKTILSRTKLIEGTLAGIAFATAGAFAFVASSEAIAAATIAMGLEATEIRLNNKILSDNILVPLAAGTTIVLMRKFLG